MEAINTIQYLQFMIDGQEVTIRPLGSHDEKIELAFFNNLSANTRYFRFMEGIRELSPIMLKQLCHIDGKHSMAFVATINEAQGETQIGVSRYICGHLARDSDLEGEMALTIADKWQHKGIDKLLIKPLLEYAKNHGIKKLFSYEFAENLAMRHLAKDLGMIAKLDPDDSQLVAYTLNI
jgi:acetyltransferase